MEERAGVVVAVHRDGSHRFSKRSVDQVTLLEGLGVEGDAHAGATVKHRSRVRRDPSQPNLRQVHLIHAELLDHVTGLGYDVAPGALGENVTTRGLDLLGLPVGAVLHLGDAARVEVTGLRNPCVQIDRYRRGLLKEVLRTTDDGSVVRLAGVMGVVLAGGEVRPGEPVRVTLPPAPFRALEPV
jgi:MOSC domain-containing protein YiiM